MCLLTVDFSCRFEFENFLGVSPKAIVVQSPYVAQVQLLRDMLDGVPEAAGTEVSTIDSFQGREADAVILSMVRSESNLYNHSFNNSIVDK